MICPACGTEQPLSLSDAVIGHYRCLKCYHEEGLGEGKRRKVIDDFERRTNFMRERVLRDLKDIRPSGH
jgi:hypothetical protein